MAIQNGRHASPDIRDAVRRNSGHLRGVGAHTVLSGPVAFSEAARRYAPTTAGMLREAEDEGSIEDDRADSI